MDHRRGICKAAAFWVLGLCTYLILPDAYAQNAYSFEDVIEAKRESIPERGLTETEKRNLARTEEWRKEASTPGGDLERLVNEIYAKSTEVFTAERTSPICRKERRKQGKLARSGVKWPRACIHQTRDEAYKHRCTERQNSSGGGSR